MTKPSLRYQVALNIEDEKLIRKLKHVLENKFDKTLTVSEVVRLAVKTSAQAEGISI